MEIYNIIILVISILFFIGAIIVAYRNRNEPIDLPKYLLICCMISIIINLIIGIVEGHKPVWILNIILLIGSIIAILMMYNYINYTKKGLYSIATVNNPNANPYLQNDAQDYLNRVSGKKQS